MRVLGHVAGRPLAEEEFPESAQVTVSIGVGAHDKESVSWKEPSEAPESTIAGQGDCRATDLVRAAGTALMAAIEGGRNQAKVADIAAHASSPQTTRRGTAVA